MKILAAVFTFLILAVAAPGWAEEPAPIKVGALLPFTGFKEAAFALQKGLDMAVEDINKNGGIDGRPIQIIYRDDKGDPGEAIKAAEDLYLNDHVVMLTGTIHDHVKMAVSDYAKRNQLMFLCSSGGSDAFIGSARHDFAYRIELPNYLYVQVLAEAASKLPAKRWALVAPNYEYGYTLISDFKTYLKKLRPDVEFVYEQFPATLKMNGGATVGAILAHNPDAVLTGLFGTDNIKFIREGKKRGLFDKVQVVSALGGFPENLAVSGSETIPGWITLGYPWQDIEIPAHRQFAEEYVKRFGESPKVSSLDGHMSGVIIGKLLRQTPDQSPQALAQTMKNMGTIDTVIGPLQFTEFNQLDMGVWLGKTGFREDGTPDLVDWTYIPGSRYKYTPPAVDKAS